MSERDPGHPDLPERRDDPRVPIELRVEYKKLNTFFADYTKNICKGGTFIRTKKPLDVGTIFLFQLSVPTSSGFFVRMKVPPLQMFFV